MNEHFDIRDKNNFNGFEIIGYNQDYVYFKNDNIIVIVNLHLDDYAPDMINPENISKITSNDLKMFFPYFMEYRDACNEYINLLLNQPIKDLNQAMNMLNGDYVYYVTTVETTSNIYVFGKDSLTKEDEVIITLIDNLNENPLPVSKFK